MNRMLDWIRRVVGRNPQVSVIIPTYNRPELLRRAITSVLKQRLRSIEVIVVDDGSSSTYAKTVCASFSDPRVSLISLQVNRGVAEARNCGARQAKAPILAFLDDDDEYDGEFLERIVGILTSINPKVDAVLATLPEGSGDLMLSQTEGVDELILSSGAGYGFSIRSKVFADSGEFDEELRVGEDTELFFRLLASGTRFAVVQSTLIRHSPQDRSRLSATTRQTDRDKLQLAIEKRCSDYLIKNPHLTPFKRQYARDLVRSGLNLNHRPLKFGNAFIAGRDVAGNKTNSTSETEENQTDLKQESREIDITASVFLILSAAGILICLFLGALKAAGNNWIIELIASGLTLLKTIISIGLAGSTLDGFLAALRGRRSKLLLASPLAAMIMLAIFYVSKFLGIYMVKRAFSTGEYAYIGFVEYMKSSIERDLGYLFVSSGKFWAALGLTLTHNFNGWDDTNPIIAIINTVTTIVPYAAVYVVGFMFGEINLAYALGVFVLAKYLFLSLVLWKLLRFDIIFR